MDCVSLREITLPDGLQYFAYDALEGCEAEIHYDPGTPAEKALKEAGYHVGIDDENGINYTYVTAPDGSPALTVAGYYGTGTEVVIPGQFNGLPVISVDDKAFSRFCSKRVSAFITRVEVSEGITSLGIGAFSYMRSLSEVILPSTLTYIGSSCFRETSNLKHIEIPAGVTEIGSYAFLRSGITSFEFPDGIKTCGSQMLYNCTSLISVRLPANMTSLWTSMFKGCVNLERMYLPDDLNTLLADEGFAKAVYYCRAGTATEAILKGRGYPYEYYE